VHEAIKESKRNHSVNINVIHPETTIQSFLIIIRFKKCILQWFIFGPIYASYRPSKG